MMKTQRDAVTTHFAKRTHPLEKRVNDTFDKLKSEGKEKVGVAHDLPKDSKPFEYFSLFIPEEVWQLFVI